MTTRWDAGTYDRVADPQARWGAEVLARLALAGHERVLDAGCGTGRVTQQLLERLPTGHVVALDASPEMLALARTRLAPYDARVSFVEADLREPLTVHPVDAVFSTATFHWVPDHGALFRNLAEVLRPGGRLVAQCGGAGNIATLERVVESLGYGPRSVHTFATPEETEARLRAAGFVDVAAWLHDEPTTFEPGAPYESFLATVCLHDLLPRVPPAERAGFPSLVASRMPGPVLDYVRLNILATRGSG